MPKYRFKTEEEFKADRQWSSYSECPDGWNKEYMNKFLGTDIPDEFNDICDRGGSFNMNDLGHGNWSYSPSNYILKPITETKCGFIIHPVKEFKF